MYLKIYDIMGFLYIVFRPITRSIFKLYNRMEIYGIENFPKEGGLLLASNHISNLDPVILGSAASRPIYFMAKDSLFKNHFFKNVMLSFNSYPLNRDKGDLAALRNALNLLKEGKVITIFPEGTRSPDGTIQKGKAGVGLLAVKSKTKILPVKIEGSDKSMPRNCKFIKPSKIIVRFGKPIDCSEYGNRKDKQLYSEISEKVLTEIKNLN